MTRTSMERSGRQKRAIAAAVAADHERRVAQEQFETREICAAECGVELRTVAAGPQFDGNGFTRRIFGGTEKPAGERRGRKKVKDSLFDPRMFEGGIKLPYYHVPVPTPAF